MSFTVLVFVYAILPTLAYLAIGLYILSLEQKKGPGYKSLAVIYFISVPSLILIGATLTFSMNYMTGKYEAGTRAPGYELYKFLVLKDIIPRSSLNLDDKSNHQDLTITQSVKIQPTQTIKFNEDFLKDKEKLNFKEHGSFFGIKENGLMVRGIYKLAKNETAQTDFYGLFTKDEMFWKGYSKHTYNDGRIVYQYNEYQLDSDGKVIVKDGIYQLEDTYTITADDFEKVKKYIRYDIPIPFKLYNFEDTKIEIVQKEESKEDINKDVIKLKINQVSLNQKYNNIINNLKLDEPYSIVLNKQGEASNISVNITKSKNKYLKDLNDQVADFIETKTNFVFNDKDGFRKEYTIITNDKYPEYKIYSYSILADTYRYEQNYPKDLKIRGKEIPIKSNMLYANLSTFGNNFILANFEIPLKKIIQSDYVKKLKQLPKKEASKLFEEFLYEKMNYFMYYDGGIDTHLTDEEKSDIVKNALVEFNRDGKRSFQGICLDTHKYNYFVKNNYKNKNCEQLLVLASNEIKTDFIEDIEKLELRLVAQLDNELEDKFITNENYYALVIGNNNYEHLEKLDAAENDAVVIADVLKNKYGFEVDLLLNADYDTTVNSLFSITNKLKNNDNLLIYYAGHGELDKAENRGYWLPVDASFEKRSKWISNQRIVDRIKATKAKHVLLVADSCFSGTLMRSGTNLQNQEPIDEKYIERLRNKKTRLVITSGGNEPVVDSDGGNHSLFALKLIDTLKNNNTVINSQILFENIRRYVVSNADQTPERAMVHKTGHDGGDFLFFPKN